MKEYYRKKIKTFIIFTSIFICLFVISFLFGKVIKPRIPFGVIYYWGTFCLFGSMFFGVIMPIILRLLFHNRVIKQKNVSFSEYKEQQKIQVSLAFVGTLFIFPALLFPIPSVHLYVTLLAVLYTIYSIIPSMKTITSETNLYNIKIIKD